jgi:hypothetical protein
MNGNKWRSSRPSHKLGKNNPRSFAGSSINGFPVVTAVVEEAVGGGGERGDYGE